MKLTGTIEAIFETQKVTDSFSKREFVVKVSENPAYPELIKLEFIQDKCSVLDSYGIGQPVEVEINLKGRAWTNPQGETKYFNSIQGWRIEKLDTQTALEQGKVVIDEAFEPATNLNEEDDSDLLPF